MGKTSVFVVEDDADISGIVAEHLGRAGYACTQAFSGTEARLVLEGARERGERFDVVVCDLMLPGLPGEDIVRFVRATDAATPIIVTSARSAASDKIDLLKLGADDYLAKPFDLDELLARIEVQLRHRGRPATPQPGGDALRVGKWTLDRAARTLVVGRRGRAAHAHGVQTSWSFWPRIRRRSTRSRSCSSWPGASPSPPTTAP